ncbi:V-type proton ATPase 116 kDa subunit a 1 isoform X1 [Lepeophtheirus salmonis]|uniref:V-type proton ATPase 116 kDa subunit a 1 isoform X1 n=2 Tax=Lepeophtheirus salmonis TaxID=72036 RepID=UPI001AEADB44|nr:V-type proton ATPase 116 kDa subunit a1-like isoform X1 [Lepeophtheirus salmonis]
MDWGPFGRLKRTLTAAMSGYSNEFDEESSYQDGGGFQMQEQAGEEGAQLNSGGVGGEVNTQPPPPSTTPGSLFRSEEMVLCQLFLQSEAAYACVSELGELGLVQFRDLNPDTNVFNRKFVNEVRRCDEMERKLRYLESEIKKDDIPMLDTHDSPEAPQPREMIDMEATFEKLEHELQEVNQNAEALKKNYLELTELKHILRKTQQFFDEQDQLELGGGGGVDGQHQQLISEETGTSGLQLGFVAGVILRERLPAFERMLWRACRGNVFLRQAEIEDTLEDPAVGSQGVLKSVFVIFFQGDQLKSRVKKICEGFRATLYPCPDQSADRREMAVGVMQRLEDLSAVLGQTNDHRHRVLVAAAKNVKSWFVKVRKIKAIYHTLNLFNLDVTYKCLISECWVPSADIDSIQLALRRGTEKSGSTIAPVFNVMITKESPPTFFRTNKFTLGFQEMINSYGIATYQEANPAFWTVTTFPFLFAVMFGDAGHATIGLCVGLWMCLKEKQLAARKIENEMWKIFFSGRYIITLMAMFSIYTGLIYNDFFSKSVNIFGSSWKPTTPKEEMMSIDSEMIDPSKGGYANVPYPFGVDPVWQVSDNKIIFLNAFKMKVSIILGVIQMTFGVVISNWNNKFFGKTMNIFAEFIPQIIFLMVLFGYLALLIFHKWVTYFANDLEDSFTYSERCAPSILLLFINMVLNKDTAYEEACGTPYMFAGQGGIQQFFRIIAVICIPWMLLVKPFLVRKDYKARVAANGGRHPEGEEPFNFVEIMILQGIHTIEYVLGSVSHTASYLRLWALSLAHAQLSEVLWMMVLRSGFSSDQWYGGVILWFAFSFWAVVTVMILILMEGLSAFLHTLRLHWVEFMSKFYSGSGHLFLPFSFEEILQKAESSCD